MALSLFTTSTATAVNGKLKQSYRNTDASAAEYDGKKYDTFSRTLITHDSGVSTSEV